MQISSNIQTPQKIHEFIHPSSIQHHQVARERDRESIPCDQRKVFNLN
jgi:hypothetical protein